MRRGNLLNTPIAFPVVFFAVTVAAGAVALRYWGTNSVTPLNWTDAVFTSTSAACVTGLSTVDTGRAFGAFGRWVILFLMQVGGLGIMTFTSLSIYLWRRRTTITDRIAVGQALMQDARFNLGGFLVEIVCWTAVIEAAGAAALHCLAPDAFTPFSAVFHAVSAFCNAGFALFPDSLQRWRADWGVNLVFMVLIVAGGLGFSVFVECRQRLFFFLRRKERQISARLSGYSKVVLSTSATLIVLGWAAVYFAEFIGRPSSLAADRRGAVLSALFQSITCRTAGFSTMDIGSLTNVTLVIFLCLMFIGGAPGSCAGGIKVTTFRVLLAAIWSQLRGRRQTVIGRFAVPDETVRKALVLFVLSSLLVFGAVLVLDFTEGGDRPHALVRGQFLEIVFEAVSAFGTVGLSTGVTAKLTAAGKWVVIALMFAGRLGPFVLINVLLGLQDARYYDLPEERMMIG